MNGTCSGTHIVYQCAGLRLIFLDPVSLSSSPSRSRSVLSRRRVATIHVLLDLTGQAKKTSRQIFVFSLQLGIINLIRLLAKDLSQPFTLGAGFHGFQ